jgi:hypothetical protein
MTLMLMLMLMYFNLKNKVTAALRPQQPRQQQQKQCRQRSACIPATRLRGSSPSGPLPLSSSPPLREVVPRGALNLPPAATIMYIFMLTCCGMYMYMYVVQSADS